MNITDAFAQYGETMCKAAAFAVAGGVAAYLLRQRLLAQVAATEVIKQAAEKLPELQHLRNAAATGPLSDWNTEMAVGLIKKAISGMTPKEQSYIRETIDQDHVEGRKRSVHSLLTSDAAQSRYPVWRHITRPHYSSPKTV